MKEHRSWHVCEACGHWQRTLRESQRCESCGWPRLLAGIDGDPLNHGFRVLVDASLRSDGTWTAAIRSSRLVELIRGTNLLSSIKDRLASITFRSPGHFPSESDWELCRRDVGDLVRKFVSELDAIPPEKEPLRYLPVSVSFKCSLVDRDIDIDVKSPLPGWVVCIPFLEASEDTARKLDERDIDVTDISQIGFDERSDKLSLKFMAKHSVIIEGVDIADSSGEQPLQRFDRTIVAPRKESVRITDLQLTAEVIRGMSSSNNGRLLIRLKGRPQPLGNERPSISAVPLAGRAASLFLDLGSTSSKWVVELRTGYSVELTSHIQESSTLTGQLGLDEYRKLDVIGADAEATARWVRWWTDAVPALRYWVGREYNAYLQDINFSVPVTLENTGGVSSQILDEDEYFNSAKRTHLVRPAAVRLTPEHELIAEHYLAPLRVLERSAHEYVKLVKRRGEEVTAWSDDWNRLEAYKSKPLVTRFFIRLLGDRPSGPRGRRPERLQSPPEKVGSLAERVGQLSRVLILDAGGLSLDVAVIENKTVVSELGQSLTNCGGEALSSRIGRRRVGKEGTRYKSHLGAVANAPLSKSDPKQQEYCAQTQALYEPGLGPVFETLGTRWRDNRRCVAVLTGGGSKNPYFVKLIEDMARLRDLDMWPVDADSLDEIVDAWGELTSTTEDAPEVVEFRRVLGWSRKRETHRTASWDQFAVIGGMLCKRAPMGQS